MRGLARALLLAACAASASAAFAESPFNAPAPPVTNPDNPNNASNPEGAPKPPPKWEMSADQRGHRGECLKLTKQIGRYERDADWAQARGNALWEYSNRERVYRLAAKREDLCPSPKGPSAEELLLKAAQMAIKVAKLASMAGL
jgi:hypothetical protein